MTGNELYFGDFSEAVSPQTLLHQLLGQEQANQPLPQQQPLTPQSLESLSPVNPEQIKSMASMEMQLILEAAHQAIKVCLDRAKQCVNVLGISDESVESLPISFGRSIFLSQLSVMQQQTDSWTSYNNHRQRFSNTVVSILKDEFEKCSFPTKEKQMEIAERCGLNTDQVKNWFGNARKRQRN